MPDDKVLQEISNTLKEILVFSKDEFGSKDSIFVRENTVVKNESQDYNVLEILGRPGRSGYLISDDGNIEFWINKDDKNKITVKTDEKFPFDNKGMKINQIKIRTDSATKLGFRLVLA